jgi:hypothetical protein
VLAVGDHCAWFYYFTTAYYPFAQILAFFFVCVWLIPFAFFISLSANDNALPQAGNVITSTGAREDLAHDRQKKHSGWLLSMFGFIRSKQPDNILGAQSSIKLS